MKHYTRVGRWKVENGAFATSAKMSDGTPLLTPAQLQKLDERAVRMVFEHAEEVGGGELKFARKVLGLKQVELGEFLGANGQTICRWENSQEPLTVCIRRAVLQLIVEFEATGALAKLGTGGEAGSILKAS